MEIKTRKELAFCMKADYMMACGKWRPSFISRIKWMFLPDSNLFLRLMRKTNYYSHFQRFSWGGSFIYIL